MHRRKMTDREKLCDDVREYLKRLTAAWYRRMSGEIGWKDGERIEYEWMFRDALSELERLESINQG